MNLFLIGYRCTGKTSVGLRLARSLKMVFADTDETIQRERGMTIARLVEGYGWEDFRAEESRVLQELCRGQGRVVSTGGGIILSLRNRQRMRQAGMVVWLKASPQVIATRMAADPQSESQRPALTGLALSREIDTTLAERLPLYEAAAHFAVDSGLFSIEALCHEIASRWDDMRPAKG
jgi:shikimate kinase